MMNKTVKTPTMKSKYGNSSYWLQDWDNEDIVVSTMSDLERKSHDLYKLSASKRAISNFVNIVTNQQIPVTFNTRGDSYTDGKRVVIGSEVVEPKDFDVAVGLALHEGSHIKLSDFTILEDLRSHIPTELVDLAIKRGINTPVTSVKDVWNYIEDRRIDHFVFNSAPGYRDYYRAMYDKYFNDPLIDKGLASDEYTDENLESYMFRIINMHNKNTDLKKLKGLMEIYKLIGLGTISRLKSSKDTFGVALQVFEAILSNIKEVPQEGGEGQSDGTNNSDNSDSRQISNEEFDQLMDSIEDIGASSPMSGDMENQPGGGSSLQVELPEGVEGGTPMDSTTEENSEVQKVHLSDRQKDLLEKKIQKQKDFMNGDVRKKQISRSDSASLQQIDESGSEVQVVGTDIQQYGGMFRGIDCVVIKNMTRSLMESSIFPLTRKDFSTNTIQVPMETEVGEGIRIGTILGKKLQVRGEDRSTIFNRQKVGKIDKRMISSLGFGNEAVFQYMETDSYKKANLHISIDASGSMSGAKWSQTITNVVAICKAVDMIPNLEIQISIRSTTERSPDKPLIVLAYDSRKDKFSKIKQLFPALYPGGTTPEGLCFEAILNQFVPMSNDVDSYFLNISDGEPYFTGSGLHYHGETGIKHTARMVKKIQGMGIKVLSYFVSDYVTRNPSKDFVQMYGTSARAIDVTSVGEITKTMNGLFMTK
jgi:hypothetical protein